MEKDVSAHERLKWYALRILSARPYTRSDLKRKLQTYCIKKHLQPDLVDRILETITKLGYINDEQYAQNFIGVGKKRFYSSRFLEGQLKRKGIDRETVGKVLNAKDNEFISDEKTAQAFYEKILSRYRHEIPLKRKKKIADALLRRGFSWQIIKKLIDPTYKKE